MSELQIGMSRKEQKLGTGPFGVWKQQDKSP
jgi:hypothetical protein